MSAGQRTQLTSDSSALPPATQTSTHQDQHLTHPLPPRPAIAILVVAGGQSTRFGGDKMQALLPSDHGPVPLAEVTCRGVAAALAMGQDQGHWVIWDGPWVLGSFAPPSAARVVADHHHHAGPAAAVAQALELLAASAAPPDLVLVVPGDAPRSGLAVPDLIQGLRRFPCVVGIDHTGQVQPLHAGLRLSAIPRGLTAQDWRGKSVRAWWRALSAHDVALPAAALRDIDTTADLATFVESTPLDEEVS